MSVLVKILEVIGYVVITTDGRCDVKTVMMVRKVGGRDVLMPPSIILTKINSSPFIDIKVYYDMSAELDSPLIPLTIQNFGLNHTQDGPCCVLYYRLFDTGYDEKYVRHVLKNLGACLIALIEGTSKPA